MGRFKKLFALPRSPGLKIIALIMYGAIAFFIVGFMVNFVGGL